VVAVNHVRTIHHGPDTVFVAMSVDFRDDISLGDGETLIEELETELKRTMPELASIYIRPEKAADATDTFEAPSRPSSGRDSGRDSGSEML